MALFVKAGDVPSGTIDMETTSFTTELVHGERASLMVATRPPGYHSKPHTHECEQLNYLQSGSLWIFIEKEAYLLEPGDYLRIPDSAIHWSWNRGQSACILIEVHAPGLQADPMVEGVALGLFGQGEAVRTSGSPVNRFLEHDPTAAESKSQEVRS